MIKIRTLILVFCISFLTIHSQPGRFEKEKKKIKCKCICKMLRVRTKQAP